MTLTASVLHDDGLVMLALAGELDVATTALVQSTLDTVLAAAPGAGPLLLVVDLSGLVFCDSTGLGTLVRASRRVHDAGGRCVLAGATGPVDRLLRLMSMERLLVLADEVGPALEQLREDAERG